MPPSPRKVAQSSHSHWMWLGDADFVVEVDGAGEKQRHLAAQVSRRAECTNSETPSAAGRCERRAAPDPTGDGATGRCYGSGTVRRKVTSPEGAACPPQLVLRAVLRLTATRAAVFVPVEHQDNIARQ